MNLVEENLRGQIATGLKSLPLKHVANTTSPPACLFIKINRHKDLWFIHTCISLSICFSIFFIFVLEQSLQNLLRASLAGALASHPMSTNPQVKDAVICPPPPPPQKKKKKIQSQEIFVKTVFFHQNINKFPFYKFFMVHYSGVG